MKNGILYLFTLILFFNLGFSTLCLGQTSELVYKVKGKSSFSVTIEFANAAGNTVVQPAEYINSSDIYWLLSPSGENAKEIIKEDDVTEYLSKISLAQGEKRVNQSAAPKNLFNDKGKIEKLVIAFSKSEFTDYLSFFFSIENLTSEKISIREVYFSSYLPQKAIYEQGIAKLEKNDFVGAFTDFMQILENAKTKKEIQTFSFYRLALDKEIPRAIDLLIKSEFSKFNQTVQSFQKEKQISTFNNVKSFVLASTKNMEIFDSYLALEGESAKASKNQILSFVSTLSNEYNKIAIAFEMEMMNFFKTNNYSNYKFSVFVNLISKMLLHKSSLSFVEKLEPIDINLLKIFPETKKELAGALADEFKFYVEVINKNIVKQGKVFEQEITDHLWELNTTQKQPYFEIIFAFNNLNSDKELFKDYINTILTKSTDENFIDYTDVWLLSYKLKEEGINASILSQLNEGISLIQKEQNGRADEAFEILMRNAYEYAPVWLYAGKVKQGLGESYSAERFFKKALEINPQYIAAHKLLLKLNLRDKNYPQLIENVASALYNADIWFFRYMKAIALYNLENYPEALDEITQQCFKWNNLDINLYFLLGDTYLALKDFDKAKENYEKTLDINPFSTDTRNFDAKMKIYHEKLQEVGAIKNK